MSIVNDIFNSINAGDYSPAFIFRQELNERITFLLEKPSLDISEVEDLRKCIIIGNATYENTDTNLLPIDSGIWDLMVEKYRKYTPDDSYPIGSMPSVKPVKNIVNYNTDSKRVFSRVTDEDVAAYENMIFPEIMDYNKQPSNQDIVKYLFSKVDNKYVSKRLHDTAHNHPDLVGTFDKCKFVLNSQAREKGVENDPSVRIMERDFFKPLLDSGVIDYNTELTMIATLKYDGISVEADVSDRVESARTRGDTGVGVATDMTPILGGYRFTQTPIGFMTNEPIGMKFEAIVDRFNLAKLNQTKGCNYINCRTAIIGVTGSSDGYLYRDLISLIPISTDYKDDNGEPLDRLVEIEFLNRYYARDHYLRYSVLSGTYTQLLFQIKKYVEEAEFARSYLPFMYDGVVLEFYDPRLRKALGRDNSMDRYKCAIKFNPMVKHTIFREYKYTIGQDGSITPMIYYDPVDFFGSIHPKSSGHSYSRFKELDLHVGDIIEVTYRNDVITYVTKPDNSHNRENAKNPYTQLDSFPTECPVCGTPIIISPTGKSAYCPNIACPERTVKRLAATLSKLGVVDFGEETVRALGYNRFIQFYSSDIINDLLVLGPNDGQYLYDQLQRIKTTPIYDYKIIGALGFDNLAEKTWQLIFRNIGFSDFIDGINDGSLTPDNFPSIKGIGPETVATIFDEWNYFHSDILFIKRVMNVIPTVGTAPTGKQIRFTGCRDKALETRLVELGHDANGNAGVTTQTDILLVPNNSYDTGSKVQKAKRYGVAIISIQDFTNNMSQYL